MSDYFYAQIDANNVVVGVSQLSSGVVADHMIPIATFDESLLGQVHQPDGTFIKPTPPPPTLDETKAAKLSSLQSSRDNAIYSKFTSSAMGTTKTYNYSQDAAADFLKQTSILALDTSITSVDWYTIEDGATPVTHTRAQFAQVVHDGSANERSLRMKYFQLEGQVNAATTISGVNAITW